MLCDYTQCGYLLVPTVATMDFWQIFCNNLLTVSVFKQYFFWKVVLQKPKVGFYGKLGIKQTDNETWKWRTTCNWLKIVPAWPVN